MINRDKDFKMELCAQRDFDFFPRSQLDALPARCSARLGGRLAGLRCPPRSFVETADPRFVRAQFALATGRIFRVCVC